MSNLYSRGLDELKDVFARLDDAQVNAAVNEIATARRIACYACGREKLQIMGFCMRLYHMGLDVAMTGDMTTPPLGKDDLFLAVCGPGEVSTTTALVNVAHKAGARTLVVTAEPEGITSRLWLTSHCCFRPRPWPITGVRHPRCCPWAPCSKARCSCCSRSWC